MQVGDKCRLLHTSEDERQLEGEQQQESEPQQPEVDKDDTLHSAGSGATDAVSGTSLHERGNPQLPPNAIRVLVATDDGSPFGGAALRNFKAST